MEGDDRPKYDLGLIKAATFANLATGPEYWQTLQSTYTDKMLQAYGMGEFIPMNEGQVYYAFAYDSRNPKCQVREIDEPEGVQLFVGMDFNVDPMAAAIRSSANT